MWATVPRRSLSTKALHSLGLRDPALLRTSSLIHGQWQSPHPASLHVEDPATKTTIAEIAPADASTTEDAIRSAADAFPQWSAQPSSKRASLLARWNTLILDHRHDLARILTFENGKPLGEARSEVRYAASFVHWFAEETRRALAGTALLDGTGTPGHPAPTVTARQPVGVSAAITPWNFPAAMVTRKAAAALGAGCTMVVKPSELTPLTALALGELALRAGVPPGVLNVVVGDAREVGGALTASTVVRKLSFTGSTATGKLLLRECANTVKRVSMELGGHAPFVVMKSADLDSAVTGLMANKFRAGGQTCICANRIFVQRDVVDEFVAKLHRRISRMKVGNGFESDVDIGPLISETAVSRMESQVSDALANGGEVVIGGKRLHGAPGYFFEPTLVARNDDSMLLAREETFGPVLGVFEFDAEDEAIERANNTNAGLAAFVYTNDVRQAWRMSSSLQYGMVGLNTSALSDPRVPFGGVKESGIGREGSDHGLHEFTDVKFINFGHT